jgi:hypothetical protein
VKLAAKTGRRRTRSPAGAASGTQPTQFVRSSAYHPDGEYDIFTGLFALAPCQELKQAGCSY